jgi:hypothetical protein
MAVSTSRDDGENRDILNGAPKMARSLEPLWPAHAAEQREFGTRSILYACRQILWQVSIFISFGVVFFIDKQNCDARLLKPALVPRGGSRRERMRNSILALFAGALRDPSAVAAAQSDVAAPIRQFTDGFNSGDTKSAFAAYAEGDVQIIDEFAPHR